MRSSVRRFCSGLSALFASVYFFTSCEYDPPIFVTLYLENKCVEPIYVRVEAYNVKDDSGAVYPIMVQDDNTVEPGKSTRYSIFGRDDRYSDTLYRVFVIKKSTVEKCLRDSLPLTGVYDDVYTCSYTSSDYKDIKIFYDGNGFH